MNSTIFSIGHGNKERDDFIKELKSFNIAYLLDVRSKPYSRWNPDFNKETLESILNEHGITYVFMGDKLGGLPADTSCYDSDGKVAYDMIKEKDFFKEGMERLITANKKRIELAVMCSESKPGECHRSKLIGQELAKKGITMKHIIDHQKIKLQQEVMNELTKGQGTVDLFGNEKEFTSRKNY